MAGDWIKLRVDLQSHPKVVRILSATGTDKFRVVGGLHAVWGVFDTHSIDGELRGYTPTALDHIIGWQGFADAMMLVGWLAWDQAETLSLPEFDEHNGKSGKRRAEDQKRKRNGRKSPEPGANPSAKCPQPKRTESGLEIEIEESKEEAPVVPKGDAAESAVIDAYHRNLPNCQRVSVRNPKRVRRIASITKLAKQVARDQGWEWDAPEFWSAYFGECAKDAWMRGDVPNPKSASWKQNLDVLLAEDRFAGVMDRAIAGMRSEA